MTNYQSCHNITVLIMVPSLHFSFYLKRKILNFSDNLCFRKCDNHLLHPNFLPPTSVVFLYSSGMNQSNRMCLSGGSRSWAAITEGIKGQKMFWGQQMPRVMMPRGKPAKQTCQQIQRSKHLLTAYCRCTLIYKQFAGASSELPCHIGED